MIAAGISFMIMGSPAFLKDFLPLTINKISLKINYATLFTGLLFLVIGLLNLAYPSDWWYVLFALVIGSYCYYALKVTQRMMREGRKDT